VSKRLTLTKLVSMCRRNIQDGLGNLCSHWLQASTDHESPDIITATLNPVPEKRVVMNYENYERKIVETYSIALETFPLGTVVNPGKIGRREDLVRLLDSLMDGSCEWVKLTDTELTERVKKNIERQARGEKVYKPRKRRTNATSAKSQGVKSKEVIDDEDDEEEQHADIDHENGEV
jgi:hypothetical protein